MAQAAWSDGNGGLERKRTKVRSDDVAMPTVQLQVKVDPVEITPATPTKPPATERSLKEKSQEDSNALRRVKGPRERLQTNASSKGGQVEDGVKERQDHPGEVENGKENKERKVKFARKRTRTKARAMEQDKEEKGLGTDNKELIKDSKSQ